MYPPSPSTTPSFSRSRIPFGMRAPFQSDRRIVPDRPVAHPRGRVAECNPGVVALVQAPTVAGAAPSAVRRTAAAQTIVNQSWDGVGELPAGWRTFDDNGATTGGQIYWAI